MGPDSPTPTSAPGRYFPDPHPGLSGRLDAFLAGLRAQLQSEGPRLGVAALVLGGGYGRGEGGVFRDEQPAAPPSLYNDVEFYLLLNGRLSRSASDWIRRAEDEGHRLLGVEVEIRARPFRWLEASPPSMFLYDLACGHAVVFGPPGLLSAERFPRLRDPSIIPAHEAARLLFNRGSGLFFCALMLEGREALDPIFIQRNHAKLKLALGDALLAAAGRYHWSCLERSRRMETGIDGAPPFWDEIRAMHREGVAFKLHPRHLRAEAGELRSAQQALAGAWKRTFLWIESRRLNVDFADTAAYAAAGGRVLPEFGLLHSLACRTRDLLVHRETLPGWPDYTRGTLQRALAAFLGPEDRIDLAAGASILACGSPENAPETYRRWWRRYN